MEYILKKDEHKTVTVREVQKQLLGILEAIDSICKKKNIPYFLDWGTALGAYRHHGFIPWDDDLDISIKREDYERFVQAMKELPDSFVAQCFELDSRYNVVGPAMKIRKKGTFIRERNKLLMNKCPCDGIFIDVFVYNHVSSNLVVDGFFHAIECVLLGMIVGLENFNFNPKILKRSFIAFARFYGKICKNSPYVGIELTWNFSLFHLPRYRKEDIFPLSECMFEDKMYPVVQHLPNQLEQTYGKDYMTPKRPIFSGDKSQHIVDINLEDDQGSIAYKKYIKRKGILLRGCFLAFVFLMIAIYLLNETSFLLLGVAFVIVGATLLFIMNQK